MKTVDIMKGRWFECLVSYGMDPSFLRNRGGPCPICGGRDRFRFDDKDGSGSFFCSHCQPGTGMTLLQLFTGRGFKDLAPELDKNYQAYRPVQAKKVDNEKAIAKLREGMVPLEDGDLVHRYLAGRGIQEVPKAFLRYHPSVYHWDEKRYMPAMCAVMQAGDGSRAGYHLTFLDLESGKAKIEKSRLYTRGESGKAAIRLCAVSDHIHLAEGIETALSVKALSNVGCWATGDAGRLENFQPPKGCKKITVHADIDHNHRGEQAAETLAFRMHQLQIEVSILRECVRGEDHNDILMASRVMK